MDENRCRNENVDNEDDYRNDMTDQLFDSVLKRACAEIYQEEYEQDIKDAAQMEMPKELDDRIFAALAQAKAEEDKARRKANRRFWLPKPAIVFLCMAVIGVATMPQVDAFRVRMQNLFMGITDSRAELKYKLDDTEGMSESEMPLPKYLPKGYRITESGGEGGRICLLFENEKKESLVFELSETEVTQFNFHTVEVSNVDINGIEGCFFTKKDTNALIWEYSKYAYSLSGTVSKDELIKVAESVGMM